MCKKNRCENKKRYLKGQFAVETVLVFPIVFLIVLTMIYTSFYLQDRVVIKAWAYKSGIESVFDEQDLHMVSSKNYEKIQVYVTKNSSIQVDESQEKIVKAVGIDIIPLKNPLAKKNEYVVDFSKTAQKIDLDKMYIFKVAMDKIEKK